MSASRQSTVWGCTNESIISRSDDWSIRCCWGVSRRTSWSNARPVALLWGYLHDLWLGPLPLSFRVAFDPAEENMELALGVVLIR